MKKILVFCSFLFLSYTQGKKDIQVSTSLYFLYTPNPTLANSFELSYRIDKGYLSISYATGTIFFKDLVKYLHDIDTRYSNLAITYDYLFLKNNFFFALGLSYTDAVFSEKELGSSDTIEIRAHKVTSISFRSSLIYKKSLELNEKLNVYYAISLGTDISKEYSLC